MTTKTPLDLPILYSLRRCPYAMRARLGILLANQQVLIREIVTKDKPEELLECSPKGTVPVLVLSDGKVIEQSLQVMVWALELNDPQDLLRQSDDEAHRNVFELIEENELESSKHQLNNFNFYEPKLVHDFYLKYFTNDILFKTDILELKDFLEFHYYYCDNPIKYYEILDFKVLPKVQEIIDNAQMSFGGGGYFNEEKLDYGFVESEGTIHNYDYEYFYETVNSSNIFYYNLRPRSPCPTNIPSCVGALYVKLSDGRNARALT